MQEEDEKEVPVAYDVLSIIGEAENLDGDEVTWFSLFQKSFQFILLFFQMDAIKREVAKTTKKRAAAPA